MDIFRTALQFKPPGPRISYHDNILLLGSCFTSNIGNTMESLHFKALVNPFGVLFNPSSIAYAIQRLANNNIFSSNELHQYNNLWFSFSHHSSFSHPDKNQCLEQINQRFYLASAGFKNYNYLSLTFGTAWVYRYRQTGEIVANCHKIPEAEFERFLLSPDEIATQFLALIADLHKINPGLKVILSVSPVRHLGDGMDGNQLSKSILHVAVHKIVEKVPECYYFPAYEILMDDLRDYRFYEPDMIHPNSQAIDYIWNIFRQGFMDAETIGISSEVQKIRDAASHRPLNPDRPEYRKFCESQLMAIGILQSKYPFLDLAAEEQHFKGWLRSDK